MTEVLHWKVDKRSERQKILDKASYQDWNFFENMREWRLRYRHSACRCRSCGVAGVFQS